MEKTLTTNNILYCVKILTKGLQIAACGAGESIVIWSLERGTLDYNIHLNSLKHCNLSTNCIMSLQWLDDEGTSIVWGGYDGNVTQWFLNRDACVNKSLSSEIYKSLDNIKSVECQKTNENRWYRLFFKHSFNVYLLYES